MKKLSNLIGAKALNKTEQQSIFGGVTDADAPTPTGDGNGGTATSGSGTGSTGSNGCPWGQCRNAFNRCVPTGLGTCA